MSLRQKRKWTAWDDEDSSGYWGSPIHDIRVRKTWDWTAAAMELRRWVYCGGKVLSGLVAGARPRPFVLRMTERQNL